MKNLEGLLVNWTGPKILMTVFPHPDDETMASGGLLLAAKKYGWETVVVTLTHGEAGKIYLNAKGKTLKQIRREELKKAIKILQVNDLVLGNFPDGKLKKSKLSWIKWLKKQIEHYSPSLVISYDHSGLTGHPDHISLSAELKKILLPLKPKPTLLWATLPPHLRKPPVVHPGIVHMVSKPTHILDLKWNWLKKWQAAKSHRSQKLGKGFPIPLAIILAKYHFEWYHEVDLNKIYPHKFVEFKI